MQPTGNPVPNGGTWIKRLVALAVFAAMVATIGVTPTRAATSVASAAPTDILRVSELTVVDRSDLLVESPELITTIQPVEAEAEETGYPVSMARVRGEVLGFLNSPAAGTGIDVALIDTGVAPVDGLTGAGKVIHGPDLSAEGGIEALAHVDTHGHGTFMAGIIAGEDSAKYGFRGMAPGARLVSIKVAGADGATHAAQVVAAIDWVVEHKNDNGMNIRVLNLSLGLPSAGDYLSDPLAAAVERAWHAGIVVVVAAGNNGESVVGLDSPAIDPYVIAVGATESEGSSDRDDLIPGWSAKGTGVRNPDVVAPGRSLISLRVPGSASDLAHPESVVDARFARASGTSQAAAVVTGTVAAILSQNPKATPDEVKHGLMASAADLVAGQHLDGHGRVLGDYALKYSTLPHVQTHPRALLDLPDAEVAVPNGGTWSGGTWSTAPSGATWSGATWSGGTWSGATWSGATWSGATWSGATWSGATWSGATWSGATWSGATWSGATWSGSGWKGATWSSR